MMWLDANNTTGIRKESKPLHFHGVETTQLKHAELRQPRYLNSLIEPLTANKDTIAFLYKNRGR